MSEQFTRIQQFIMLAQQALRTAQANRASGDSRATINRSYYAVFYAASAMLLTKGLERCKHSGVIAAFREQFVKSGLIEAEYSHIYGETLVVREDADYAIEIPIEPMMAEIALQQAERFVQRMQLYLVEKGFLNAISE